MSAARRLARYRALAAGVVFAGCGATDDAAGTSTAVADLGRTADAARGEGGLSDLGGGAGDGSPATLDGAVGPADSGGRPADAAPVSDDRARPPAPDAAGSDAAVSGPDAGPTGNEGCRALVDQGAYVIFAYEASHPDATAAERGVDAMGVCSAPGVLPWTDVTHAQATAACDRVGYTLCTNEQWQLACAGPDMNLFPYGGPHADAVCNDHIAGGNALEPTGNRPGCRTANGIFDQSGNVWEITAESELRGGSWRVNASTYQAEYAGCFEHLFINDFFADADVGFRCCRAK